MKDAQVFKHHALAQAPIVNDYVRLMRRRDRRKYVRAVFWLVVALSIIVWVWP